MEQDLFYSKPKYGTNEFVVVQGYNIHYIEAGADQPVLLIPGLFSTYRTWNRIIPFLSEDYMIIAIDYLGVGYSDKPHSGFDYTMEEQADLVAKLIEKLEIFRVPIVGVSYGGTIALNLAARYPNLVGKIVCIEGAAAIKPKKVPWSPMIGCLRCLIIGDILIGIIKFGLLDKAFARLIMGEAWHNVSSKERQEIIEIVAQGNKTASRVSWYHLSRTVETSKEFTEEAKTIRNPVLYLYGANSIFWEMAEANSEFLRTHLANVRIECIKDGIHDLQLQKPEEVANLILEFLART